MTPHGTIENTNFLQELNLKVGSRIMIIYNVNIPDGLVNGQMGTVIGFEFYRIRAITYPEMLLSTGQ